MKPAPGLRLGEAQRIEWLRLSRCEGVGPRTFQALINRFGGAGAALEALPELARARGKGAIRIPGPADIERELAAAARMGARFIAIGEPDYPALLRPLDGAPPVIAVAGSAEILARRMVAMDGSSNASGAGRTFTERLAGGLARAGFCIVSGLARGIDTKAHDAALETGTVAVLAGGLDRPYPPENLGLMRSIIEKGGAVIAEMPFGCEPRGRDFPRRNRIISGVAHATIVVEAARKSGSLITARFANEQGREVFAVPGSPLDPRAEGTNDLIRQGATICTSAEDVITVLEPMISTPDLFGRLGGRESSVDSTYQREPLWEELLAGDYGVPESHVPEDFEEEGQPPEPPPAAFDFKARVLEALGPAPVEIDELARQTDVPAREVRGILLDLELDGRIERHGGNRVSLAG